MTLYDLERRAAHGGPLKPLLAGEERIRELRLASRDWSSWNLTARQLCDVELMLAGAFSPLDGFMTYEEYEGVLESMRLPSGVVWPIPVVLDVDEDTMRAVTRHRALALRDPEGTMVAALHVEDVWQADIGDEAAMVYGTRDPSHPGVAALLNRPLFRIGGRVEGIALPPHYDFRDLRATPLELRERFRTLGWDAVVAFQVRNPMHLAHYELTKRAAEEADGGLLIHPVVGMTKPGDLDYYTRVRCYRALMPRYRRGSAALSLLPLAMRMAGPREALWHAIIRRNYGCTHFIVGRDHAGPGVDAAGRPFYDPYAAQELVARYEPEIGIRMVPFREIVYVEELGRYLAEDEVPDGAARLSISGTQLRRMLANGEDIPEWFSPPEVVRELRRTHPPRARSGLTLFLTGLSGAGKSTIAAALAARLLEDGSRRVTVLDGDLVRKNLSSELGFSHEHRDRNIRRIGFVAAEIAKHGGIAICAPIAPYDETRKQVREECSAAGSFVLVYVRAPLSVCEARDRKGLYAKARAGIIQSFTGITDAYEEPADADLIIDTEHASVEESVDRIMELLRREGYLPSSDATKRDALVARPASPPSGS
ncbi:MAG TPA: bifunctional sulfate adenylyltransferase/adenylylsulfate kinase [Actinomycetota bacterium]|nr:bifunctional sulfate adenylyltransferase/adenylylsulfate kinase [Actinomycetota bacterium]